MDLRVRACVTAFFAASVSWPVAACAAGVSANPAGAAPYPATSAPAPAQNPSPYPSYGYAPYPSAEYGDARYSGAPSVDLSGLERRIAEQEKQVAEQESQLKKQSARLDAQARERQAQMRLIWDQQQALERQERELQNLRAQYQQAQASAGYGRAGQAGAAAAPGYYDGPARPRYWYAQDIQPVAPTPLPPEGSQPPQAPTTQPKAPTGQPQAAPEGQAQPAPGKTETKAGEEERPKSEKPIELLLLQAGGVLLPKGRLVLEPSVDYTHSSSNSVAISGFTIFNAIVIGTIQVNAISRDIVTSELTGRYGITNRLQADFQVPYVYRQDTETLGVGTPNALDRTTSGMGIGDLQGSLEWQPITRDGWIPDTIFRVSARAPTGKSVFEIPTVQVVTDQNGTTEPRLMEAPTGTGFWGAGPGVTAVWRTDPVVLFAGGSYTFNFSRNFETFGKIDPGNTFQFFGGMNFAINQAVSMNMSFTDQITSSTKQNGVTSPATSSNDARLLMGTSVGITPQVSLLASASAGLTAQSPDFEFILSVPITFDVFR